MTNGERSVRDRDEGIRDKVTRTGEVGVGGRLEDTMWLTIWVGCAGQEPSEPKDAVDSGTPPVVTPESVEGSELLARLAGLWTGSASQTPLGTFPLMNVDLRPADPHALWGRVDIDPENALRFTLEIEDHDGPVVVYRNGGFFLGLSRDDRTILTEIDGDSYRFCHLEQGCGYIDATYTFEGDDDLIFDVQVQGAPHVYWDAHRAELRNVDDTFPSLLPLAADAPLPTLPTADITVSWPSPLDAQADVWVVLTTVSCAGLDCVPSRSSRAVAAAGDREALVSMPEIHGGAYFAIAVLDRDRDLATTGLPEATDGVSLPNQPVTVAPTGTTAALVRIVLGG